MNAIKAVGLVKSFGDKKVLAGTDIEIEAGSISGLLGPSGAGKTTLIKILTGQLRADSGSAFINVNSDVVNADANVNVGIDVNDLDGNDFRRFGIMMDDFGFYDRLTCYENLKVFADIYGTDRECITEALRRTGLSDAARTRAGNLSKGMKSRLRLARVFMTDPSIIFLDEPTSALDPVTAEEIHKLILDERDKGKTIFLTTHNMAEAEKLCSRVFLLNEGRIIEQGNPEEICRRYNSSRRINIHLSDGRDISLKHEPSSADEIKKLIADGLAVSIHSTEPNLETVFTHLTGKELAV